MCWISTIKFILMLLNRTTECSYCSISFLHCSTVGMSHIYNIGSAGYSAWTCFSNYVKSWESFYLDSRVSKLGLHIKVVDLCLFIFWQVNVLFTVPFFSSSFINPYVISFRYVPCTPKSKCIGKKKYKFRCHKTRQEQSHAFFSIILI